jgi:hypothetical protein
MTKRELIDQILHENGTAEPGFLAQFSDGQLHEYLTHLKWLKQPRLQGDASRFERYFRTCPSVTSPPARWRGARDARGSSPREAMDLSAQSAASPVATPQAPPSPAPDSPPPPAPSPPPQMRYVDFDASLPAEVEDLEAMQLSVQERTVLTRPSEEVDEADEPPAEPDPRAEPIPPAAEAPPPDTVSDDQTWLF